MMKLTMLVIVVTYNDLTDEACALAYTRLYLAKPWLQITEKNIRGREGKLNPARRVGQ